MKLSHLSLAIFSAIALAACGGSSSSSPTDNNPPPPKPQPKPQPKPKPQPGTDKIVDPTQTGVVGDLDYNTQPSQGTTQYIRGKKSKFDRVDNPTDKTSATSILGVDLKEQNPQLSNIVLARLPDPSNGNVLVQLAGNMPNYAADIWDPRSLQRQNELNVDLLVPASKDAFLNKPNANYYANRINQLKSMKDLYTDARINGLPTADYQNTAKQQRAELSTMIAIMESIYETIQTDPEYGQNVAPLRYDDNMLAWGDGKKTSADALDANGVETASTGPKANGLVALSYQEYNATSPSDKLRVQGEEAKSQSSTRIFGRNFNNNDAVSMGDKAYAANVLNSYLGAGVYLYQEAGADIHSTVGPNFFYPAGKKKEFEVDPSKVTPSNFTNFVDGFKKWKEEAYGNDTTLATAPINRIGYVLGAVPMNLTKVQYGRVTANLNPPSVTKVNDVVEYQRQPFLNKGNDRAVDTYFYRGVDATTLTQMDALKDKKLSYKGHALMYGVNNNFVGKLGGNVPNAVGSGGRNGIGNFVSAEVDLGDKTIRGGIYNVWQRGLSDDNPIEDVIVSFSGKIHGNTALGYAERVYDPADKADFRASFFGANAEELGGSINSTTIDDKYGPKDGKDVWGGVFGAKNVAGGLSNKWLGDIPKIK